MLTTAASSRVVIDEFVPLCQGWVLLLAIIEAVDELPGVGVGIARAAVLIVAVRQSGVLLKLH